ncbi:MAG: hypothetical protein LBD49_02480, partial [Oscillospiraceae bacterium]|nr:hypothetical protein [Oscillospiraceae bacterium]
MIQAAHGTRSHVCRGGYYPPAIRTRVPAKKFFQNFKKNYMSSVFDIVSKKRKDKVTTQLRNTAAPVKHGPHGDMRGNALFNRGFDDAHQVGED